MSFFVLPALSFLFLAGFALVIVGIALDSSARRARRPRRKRAGVASAVGGVGAMALSVGGCTRSSDVELMVMWPALSTVQERAVPVLAAIARFESESGHSPGDLADLVPAYLDAVPSSGLGPFRYGPHSGGVIGLHVETTRGWITFDQFIYSPAHLAVEDEGPTRRFGDWVYYLE